MVAPMLVNETSIMPCGFDVIVVRVNSSPLVGCRPKGFVVMFREYTVVVVKLGRELSRFKYGVIFVPVKSGSGGTLARTASHNELPSIRSQATKIRR